MKKQSDSYYLLATINMVAVIFIIPLLFVIFMWGITTIAKTETDIYPLLTIVTEVDGDKDLVTVEDNNGFIWQFEGVDDWKEGDLCNCLMNGRGTEEIFDDEIIITRYESGAK
jgi:hypothetical protein